MANVIKQAVIARVKQQTGKQLEHKSDEIT